MLEPVLKPSTATGAAPAMLSVENLHAWYAESKVLHGINFDVREGELLTLIGRNGAGKTTTLRAIMGILQKRTGSIRINGDELIGKRTFEIARKGIAYCPEERAHLLLALRPREPASAAGPQARRPHGRGSLRDLPEPLAAPQPGHQAFWRRTADAGTRPYPSHRFAPASAR